MADYNPMTDEEKFLFDLKGFLLFPAVLSEDEIAAVKDQSLRIEHEPESLPAAERRLPGGAAATLIDHPAVMRILHGIIGKTDKIRLESAFVNYRERDDTRRPWSPHAGGRTLNPNYSYNFHAGQIYSGMTRVVWELNPVERDRGGTAFMPGSHKANFPFPKSIDDPDSGVWESYGCPAGSLLIFSEAVRHSSAPWRQETPRVSLFFAYNHINVRHHFPDFPAETLESLEPERRRFFNEVYHPQFDRPNWAANRQAQAEKLNVPLVTTDNVTLNGR